MIAIGAIEPFLRFGCPEPLERGFDGSGDLFDGLVAVDLFEAALPAIVFDDGRGLGLKVFMRSVKTASVSSGRCTRV